MKRRVSWSLGVIPVIMSLALPTNAHALQGLRADMQMSGGALDSPASGTLFFDGGNVRLELAMDGQSMILLGDPTAGSLNLLMPEQQMYMPVAAGMSPVTPPPVTNYDPANPCASGEVTNCVSLGTEQVNGYATAHWQYDANGETWNAWIATQLQFPVRLVGADGTTTDFTNVAMGAQDASLFEIPAGYSEMPSFGGFAAFGAGRGAGPGGPPGGRGANAGVGASGLPPGFDAAAFGIDPATLAGIMAGGSGIPEPSVFEGGDGWMVTFTVTATGERSSSTPGDAMTYPTQTQESYSATWSGSVPLNYGTPGVLGGPGPAWQLIPGIGSDRGNAARFSLSAQAEYEKVMRGQFECQRNQPLPYDVTSRSTGSVEWDGGPASSDNLSAMAGGAAGLWQISPDGSTYDLSFGVGAEATEVREGVTSYAACAPDPATSESGNGTATVGYGWPVQITGEPLPAARQTITGRRTMPVRVNFGDLSGEVEATVEWTISPI